MVSLNGGDAAILDAQVRLLRRRWPQARIAVHERDPEAAARYAPHRRFVPFLRQQVEASSSVQQVRGARRLRRAAALARASAARRSRWARHLMPGVLRGVDLVLYTGGTSLTENYSLAGKLFDLELVRRAGIPYAFLPQSAGPFADPDNRDALAPIFRDAALVMLRDQRSLRHVVAAGARPERCAVVPDVVFAMARRELARPPERSGPERVAVSVREWRHFTTCSPQEGRERTVAAFRHLATALVRERGAEVVFVSTCQGRPEYAIDDAVFAREIVGGLDLDVTSRVTVDARPRATTALIDTLATFDAVVSMRLHTAILAVCSGVPTLTVAYEYKSTEVWAQLGQEDLTLDLEGLDGERLAATASLLLDDREHVRADLAPRVAVLRDEALGLGDLLADSLETAARTLQISR